MKDLNTTLSNDSSMSVDKSKIVQSEAIEKKRLLNTEISKEESQTLSNIPIPLEYKNRKLYCRIWDETGTRTLVKPKKVPYGIPFFSAKVGGRDRYFKINYNTRGMIKSIDGRMFYDTAFDNATGGYALRNYEFPEDIDSEEAYTIFKNNAVNMYVKKGGIPMIYLMVAMGIALVAMIMIIAVVPAGLQAQDQVKELDKQVTVLKAQNQVLQKQANELSGLAK